MKKVLSALVSILVPAFAFAAGSVTMTETNYNWLSPVRVVYLSYQGAADAIGTVSVTTPVIAGDVRKVQFVPTIGATGATNNYGVTLKDSAGIDILQGNGAAAGSNTLFSLTVATNGLAYTVAEPLTLDVTGIGSNRVGLLKLFVRP